MAASGPTAPQLFRQADLALRSVLGYDAVCWHANDPATGLVTSVLTDDLDLNDFQHAVRLELWGDDVATFGKIRRSGARTETLSRATGGRLVDSVRYREQIKPAGFGDELRAAFDSKGGTWGCAAFMRAPDRGPYDAVERGLAEVASRYLGNALRTCYQLDPAQRLEPLPPAVLVLDHRNHLVDADPGAQALLVEFADAASAVFSVPTPFATVAEHARVNAVSATGLPAKSRVRADDGRWFVLHASLLDGRADGRVAIVATPASPAEIMPVYLAAYSLTDREQLIALHAVRGRSTAEIAKSLSLTANTVQDHLKSVFAKTGVRSRRELVALVMTTNTPEIWF